MWRRRLITILWTLLSVILFVIGLAGVPDDVSTWGKWIAWAQPHVAQIAEEVNREIVGYILMVIATAALIGIHGGPRVYAYVQYRRSLPTPANIPSSEKGFLDHLVDAPRSTMELTKIMGLITRDTLKLGKKISRYTKQFSSKKSLDSKIVIASRTAKTIDLYSDRMDQHLVKFELVSSTFIESTVGTKEHQLDTDQWSNDDITSFLSTVTYVRETIASARKQFKKYRNAVNQVKNISQDMNRAASRLEKLLNKYTISYQQLYRAMEKFERLLQNRKKRF